MMTVKQVARATGVSVRALQFYDGIGLLRPTQVTAAGYRLYGPQALETLQQILFFKELDFTLKEIKAMMEDPAFDRAAAFERQRQLLSLKRDRLNGLLDLLERLAKGEKCMEFDRFDMSGYFAALEEFKATHRAQLAQRLGEDGAFDKLLQGLYADRGRLGAQVEELYGGEEAFTRAALQHLEQFLAQAPAAPEQVQAALGESDALTRAVTADLALDPACPQVQAAVGRLVACCQGQTAGDWAFLADAYGRDPVFIQAADKKYGAGAAQFLSRALKAYLAARP